MLLPSSFAVPTVPVHWKELQGAPELVSLGGPSLLLSAVALFGRPFYVPAAHTRGYSAFVSSTFYFSSSGRRSVPVVARHAGG